MELLREGCEQIGIELTEKMCKQFKDYKEIMLEWNKKVNLTAITDEKEIVTKHFIDSLTLLTTDEFQAANLKIIDVGTGAGFPAIPLRIVKEDIKQLTLLDSLNKRIVFLQELVDKLELSNVESIHSRAEDLGRSENYREQYDICISRAVANMAVLAEYCLPFVKVGGKFISLKGNSIKEEISAANKAISILGGEVSSIKTVKIPFSDIEHTLVIISKLNESPSIYPRKSGKAIKNPILR